MAKTKKLRIQPFPGVDLRLKKDGSIGIRKVGLTSERVKNDPAFRITLAKALVFGRAATWASRIVRTLKPALTKYKIRGCHKRLLGRLMTELNAAPLASSDLSPQLAEGFQCSRFSFLQQTIHSLFRIRYTRNNKTIIAALSSLRPALDINFPIGATHCKLSLLLTLVCWQTGENQMQWHEDNVFYRINHIPTNQMEIVLERPGLETYFVLAAVGVQYFITSIDEQELYPFCNAKLDTFDICTCRLLTNTV